MPPLLKRRGSQCFHDLGQFRFFGLPHDDQCAVFYGNRCGLAYKFVAHPDGEAVGQGTVFHREAHISQGHALSLSLEQLLGEALVLGDGLLIVDTVVFVIYSYKISKK